MAGKDGSKNFWVRVFISPRWIAIGAVVIILCVLYWPVFVYAVQKWNESSDYSHGFFVPFASAFLIWRKRVKLKTIPIEPFQKGVIVLLGGLLLYVIGLRIQLYQVSMFSFIIVLGGLLLFFLGKRITRRLLFPLGFLIFSIPVPYYFESFAAPLQALASWGSTGIIRLLGIPVVREGNIIYLPNFTLEVEVVCSGLKALVLVPTIAAFYAYFTQDLLGRRVALFLLSPPIAVIANIARIVIIALIVRFSGEKLAFKFIEDFAGILIFVIAGALLVIAGGVMEWIFRKKITG